MPAAAEIFRALGALCEPPEPAHARLAAALGLPPPPDAAAFTEVFVFQLVLRRALPEPGRHARR